MALDSTFAACEDTKFFSEASPLALTSNGAEASRRDTLSSCKGPICATRWSPSNARCSPHHEHHLVQVTGDRPRLHSRTKFTLSFPGIQHNTGTVKFLNYPKFKITQSSQDPFTFLFLQSPKMILVSLCSQFSDNPFFFFFSFGFWGLGKRSSIGRGILENEADCHLCFCWL